MINLFISPNMKNTREHRIFNFSTQLLCKRIFPAKLASQRFHYDRTQYLRQDQQKDASRLFRQKQISNPGITKGTNKYFCRLNLQLCHIDIRAVSKGTMGLARELASISKSGHRQRAGS